MIEAMACGTPVLAFRKGSVPEVMEDDVTGRIVTCVEEAILALPKVIALDRRAVRARFEERFTAARTAKDYVNVYRSLLRKQSKLVDALEPSLSPSLPDARMIDGVGRYADRGAGGSGQTLVAAG